MIKAYAVTNRGAELEPYEYDPGPMASDDVEIDVKFCGICHSDLSMIDNQWGSTRYPLVAGHEVVGTISQVGDSVKKLKVGQVVGLGWHAGYCEQCDLCETGDHNLCSKSQATIVGRHGGFADKVRASACSVVAIPEGLDLASAGPLFCGGITVFNPLLQYKVKPTDKVAVIGIGGLGHMAIKFLSAWGCEVTAFTTSESKKVGVLEMGAHHALNSTDSSQLKDASNSFDLVISTVNVALDWAAYLNTLKPRGRLHFVGVSLEPLKIGSTALMSKQLSISSSPIGSPSNIAKMLEFAKVHDIRPIIEKYSFDDINEAIERLRSGKARYRIVLER